MIGDGLAWVERGVDFETDFSGLRYRGSTSDMIDAQVLALGGYELPLLRVMAALMPSDGVFVDAGANTGQHSLYMARRAAQVHAIEPFPPVLEVLDDRVALNHLGSVVTVHRVGLAEEPGSMPFHLPPARDNLAIGTFSKSMTAGAAGKRMELPLVRGDTLLGPLGRVDLIKLDIEGYEKPALRGMEAVLEQQAPFVVFELNVRNAEGFHGESELKSVFPPGYRFLEIITRPTLKWDVGNMRILCGRQQDTPRLLPFDGRFDRDGRNVLAVPPRAWQRLMETASSRGWDDSAVTW